MSDSNSPSGIPKWLSCTVVTLLAVQVGLLWVHGSLLQRQHDDIQALQDDVQSLADSLDADQDPDGSEDDGNADARPARAVRGRPGAWVRVARARPAFRERAARAGLESQGPSWQPWAWTGTTAVLVALLASIPLRRKG